MATYFYPGCKFTAHDKQASKALVAYCKTKLNAHIAKCCSIDYAIAQPEDTVLYICPTCALILAEANPGIHLVSLYEAILDDETFPWPDLQGEAITIQDCWRSHANPNMQHAVREVLTRMNATIVELEENFENTTFCGTSVLSEPAPRYEKVAPRLFADPIFKPLPPEKQQQAMIEHATQYTTSKVVCYCTGCYAGIVQAGRTDIEAIHLGSLIAQDLH